LGQGAAGIGGGGGGDRSVLSNSREPHDATSASDAVQNVAVFFHVLCATVSFVGVQVGFSIIATISGQRSA
jgi:hypothetical protein